MSVFRRRLLVFSTAMTLLLGAAPAAFAQDPHLDMDLPIISQAANATDSLRPVSASAPDGAGFAAAGTWVAASKFTLVLSSGTPTLTYAGSHYYNSPGSAAPARYFANIDLEPGVLLTGFTCTYVDSSATNDVSGGIAKYSGDVSTGAISGSNLGNFSTTGSPGYGFASIALSVPETFQPYPGGLIVNNYYFYADIASDTSFAGCFLWWNRQISPAPATASFTDVPTGYWAFQYIEALKASGITQGVTPTTYEPESNVTRAQMAVFLAKALGLFWPH